MRSIALLNRREELDNSHHGSFAFVQEEDFMVRERLLKILLALVGLLFSAAIYPAIGGLFHPENSDTGDTMMMAIYFALGIFLLIAVRNPPSHRSLIAFAAWSSLLTQ